ncbi:acetyl-CoA carboxylase biotin carboxylase subunit [Thermomonospora cellulosilytica]|uniref:biotin carboxylase n=1 Tax=Thermomonospora cellulosilytica TaxID=1411118 RepID=A0A7W3N138_9ACTN|nr:acetyl-CoA carboxylase biotin carboxylase subunit [Thermomonospora cellulosilytica]MBA9005527.1 acetyl-CoA carboxylase biotin carboxylase subunit [Thermomonospora cellulosilytica]
MFKTVLIANRGEIALRVARTCRELGIRTVVAHSTADRDSVPVRYADQAIQIGPAPSRHSYNNAAAIVAAAQLTGADAVHPGYGFLSEDPYFAEICQAEGLTFIGPSAEVISLLGDKMRARRFVSGLGLPVLPGSDPAVDDAAELARTAERIGYPVIIKASAGGGGRGMTIVEDPRDFPRAYAETRRTAQALFGDSRVYVEKYLETARHIEVQILADSHGNALYLGARDCSVQRRRQKLIEESPAPSVSPEDVDRVGLLAAKVAREAGYVGAGTFEFVVDEQDRFYFLEVNSRIQVEHPVTEMVTGVDLVREQLTVAAGGRLTLRQEDLVPRGAAIECRINAEDPDRGFLPTPGTIEEFVAPGGPFVRVDTHAAPGARITADYDSLLAKIIVWAPDREQAIARMDRALGELVVGSREVRTTAGFLREVLAHPLFRDAKHATSLVDQMCAD